MKEITEHWLPEVTNTSSVRHSLCLCLRTTHFFRCITCTRGGLSVDLVNFPFRAVTVHFSCPQLKDPSKQDCVSIRGQKHVKTTLTQLPVQTLEITWWHCGQCRLFMSKFDGNFKTKSHPFIWFVGFVVVVAFFAFFVLFLFLFLFCFCSFCFCARLLGTVS